MTGQSRRRGRRLGVGTLTSLVVIGLAAILVTPAQTARTVVIHVNDDAAPGGNGTGSAPYDNLTDALAKAGTTSAAVVIKVAPGNYAIASSLVIDRPLELRGSSVLIEDAEGWPTGDVVAGTETRLFATTSTLSELIRVGRGDGGVLDDVSIHGFVFQGTTQSMNVSLFRTQNFWIDANIFRAPGRGMQSAASSGRVSGNHFRVVGAGVVVGAGYAESPANVVVTGNRSVQNQLGGVVLSGSSAGISEVGDQLDAIVRDNDLSGNTNARQGFGLRVLVMSPEPGLSQTAGSVNALVQDNRMDGNRIGVQIDAGFPFRSVSGVCEARVYSGRFDLDFAGNTLTSSVQAPALVTFTRHQAALNLDPLSQWQYLHAATYTISDRDGTLASALIDHPASDPFLGPCPGDATNEPLGNVFVYNGVVLPNGRNF